MSDAVTPGTPPDGITEDMIMAAAEVMCRQYDSEHDASHLAWQDFAGDAREILAAALAGRTVIDIPEPTGVDEDGDPAWSHADDPFAVIAFIIDGKPAVAAEVVLGDEVPPEMVEHAGLVLLAAAREARRLASWFSESGEPR